MLWVLMQCFVLFQRVLVHSVLISTESELHVMGLDAMFCAVSKGFSSQCATGRRTTSWPSCLAMPTTKCSG